MTPLKLAQWPPDASDARDLTAFAACFSERLNRFGLRNEQDELIGAIRAYHT